MWIITPIKMWSLPKSIKKSILDSSSISLSSYFTLKFPFLFYKLLLICEQDTASRALLSFSCKWQVEKNTSMSKNPCLFLCWMTLTKNCSVAPCCKRDFQIFFHFTEVNFAVLGKMSSRCNGLWCRYAQERCTRANSESSAAGTGKVVLLQTSSSRLGAVFTGPSCFWYLSHRLWAVWRVLQRHQLAWSKLTDFKQSTSFFVGDVLRCLK